MNTKKLKVLTLVAAIAVMSNIFGIQSVFAVDASQTVNTAVSAGSTLSITVPGGTLNLSGVTASATATGASTGTITPITVTNDIGTGATWTVSSTSTNLGLSGTNVIQSDTSTTGTSSLTGDYDGLNPQSGFTSTGTKIAGQFAITVNTISLGIPTQVNIAKPDPAGNLTNQSVTAGAITINGIIVTFNNLWAVGEILYINVDHFPYTAFTATPATLASTNGASIVGMNLQGAGAYSGAGVTSSSRNDLIAPTNTGMGVFTFNLGLSQVTHKFPLVGTYISTITLTLI